MLSFCCIHTGSAAGYHGGMTDPLFSFSVYSRVLKKSSQELYGLICYAELRKKVGGRKWRVVISQWLSCCFATSEMQLNAACLQSWGKAALEGKTVWKHLPCFFFIVFHSNGWQECDKAQRTDSARVSVTVHQSLAFSPSYLWSETTQSLPAVLK